MKRETKMKHIFADKATLILRKMITQPHRRWVVRDFVGAHGVSIGRTHKVLESMSREGYVERFRKGAGSYTILTNQKILIDDWLKEYNFTLNEFDTYYTHDKNVLKKIKIYLQKYKYALTLHTGANLITSYVKTDEIYLYLDTETWKKDILDIRQKLDLKELVRGGNFHIIRPFYKNSVFFNSQKIRGYRVVSYLQLYLDLYNFHPRGREHAEYLKKILEERGIRIG